MTLLTRSQTWVAVLSTVRILGSVHSSWDYIEQQWVPKGKSEISSSVCPPICPFCRRGISVRQLPYLFPEPSPDLLGYQLVLGIAVWAHSVPKSCLLHFLHLFCLGNDSGITALLLIPGWLHISVSALHTICLGTARSWCGSSCGL